MESWRKSLIGSPSRVARVTGIEAGMMVTPHVRLDEPLGKGGMGTVWIAHHLTLNTQVAVKFISSELDPKDAEVLARFKREAATAAQIKSPHVVQTFDQGITPHGWPYIVLELLQGESLDDRLDRVKWLDLEETAQVIAQTAKALNSAHKLGIVHRDVKPDNIFLCESDDGLLVKVLDFGIAKHTQVPDSKSLTVPGNLIGTPEFMSPELMFGEPAGPLSDLWALAVVAYICVTGQLPFTAEAIGELCVALAKAELAPPSTVRAGVTPALDHWFKRALSREPAQRFPTAKDMALALIKAIPQRSDELKNELLYTGQHPRVGSAELDPLGLADEPSPTAPVRPWARKSTLIGAVGTVLVVAGVSAAAYLMLNKPAHSVTETGPPPHASAGSAATGSGPAAAPSQPTASAGSAEQPSLRTTSAPTGTSAPPAARPSQAEDKPGGKPGAPPPATGSVASPRPRMTSTSDDTPDPGF